VSQKVKEQVALDVEAFKKDTGITPGLATVLVGQDAASHVYVKNKIKSTEKCGMHSFHKEFEVNVTEEELLAHINELNNDTSVHGILVQLPLPKHINENKVLLSIRPDKDVDGFHPQNVGLLVTGDAHLKPCTPSGVMALLDHYGIELEGKEALVIGRSNIVGKPQSIMLIEKNATVTVAHSRTKDLQGHVEKADVVVAAIGRPKFVPGDWIKEGAVVIDVGVNRLDTGKLCGDVDFETASKKASYITPVPGGVGPMTIAMLMKNTLEAAKKCRN